MERTFKLSNLAVASASSLPINLRCPECYRLATLDSLGNIGDVTVNSQDGFQGRLYIGYRVCPNSSCNLLLFVAYHPVMENSYIVAKVLASYPIERIDFDANNIPQPIVQAFKEAIICHANSCYTAAAIMIRKTLEELCRDQKAKGSRLVDQLKDLGSKVVLPVGLVDGIDSLRLLGNDAAHVELKNFDKIGLEEIEVGIEFTKEVLKAVYQHSLLVSRLEALKKKAPPS